MFVHVKKRLMNLICVRKHCKTRESPRPVRGQGRGEISVSVYAPLTAHVCQWSRVLSVNMEKCWGSSGVHCFLFKSNFREINARLSGIASFIYKVRVSVFDILFINILIDKHKLLFTFIDSMNGKILHVLST